MKPPKIMFPTTEEDARITAAAESDADNPIWTDEDWAQAKPLSRETIAKIKRGRPLLPEEERKQRVTIYLDRDVIERLKEDGRGWQTRANKTLREALRL